LLRLNKKLAQNSKVKAQNYSVKLKTFNFLMDILLEIDQWLFLLINHLPHQSILVGLMLFFSLIGSGAVVWLVLGIIIGWWQKKRSLKSMVNFLWPLFLSLALCTILVTLILKPLVGRLRPNWVMAETRVWGLTLDDFSFPSGHATSSFACAYVLTKKLKKMKVKKTKKEKLAIQKVFTIADVFWIAKNWKLKLNFYSLSLYSLAGLISFSRVYLGKHYPSDVLVGAVLGVAIGKVAVFVDKKLVNLVNRP